MQPGLMINVVGDHKTMHPMTIKHCATPTGTSHVSLFQRGMGTQQQHYKGLHATGVDDKRSWGS